MRHVIEESIDGIAAVRAIPSNALPEIRPGWQFVWLLSVGNVRTTEQIHSIFVDDEWNVDVQLGGKLLELSRQFANEEPVCPPDISRSEIAAQSAESTIAKIRDRCVDASRNEAEERLEVERSRIESLFANRSRAAADRVHACEQTLNRLQLATDPLQRQAIPLWEANAERARAELSEIAQDRVRSMQVLALRRNPKAEYRLLCVARIQVIR